MLSKNTKPGPDYRHQLMAERDRLSPTIAARNKLPELEAAASAARDALAAYRNSKEYSPRLSRDQRLADLHADVSRTHDEFQKAKDAGDSATSRVKEIDLDLSAKDDSKRLSEELAACATEGAELEHRLRSASELAASLSSEIEGIDRKHRTDAEAAADEAVAARLEGREPKAAEVTGDDRTIARLRSEREAAQRIVDKAKARIAELTAQTTEMGHTLWDARRRAADVAFRQTMLDSAEVLVEWTATHNYDEPKVVVDQISVQRRIDELRAECGGWRPAVLPKVATPAATPAVETEQQRIDREARAQSMQRNAERQAKVHKQAREADDARRDGNAIFPELGNTGTRAA